MPGIILSVVILDGTIEESKIIDELELKYESINVESDE